VVTARDQTLERPLVNPGKTGNNGVIRITGEERQAGAKEEVNMKV
jgi:hypothetical protein